MVEEHHPGRTGRRVASLLADAEEAVLVAPFITVDGLGPILDLLSEGAAITVYTRWRANEVAAGVSDPRILDLVTDRGGEVRLHHLLHAKAYIRPGSGALIGSSNITLSGLGWIEKGSVEVLVQVDAEDPSLVALMHLISATSPQADTTVRDQILAQAETLRASNAPRIESRAGSHNLAAWLPSYPMPHVLWRVYNGERDDTVAHLVAPDLAALNPPAGLNEEEFNAYVGSVLLQGLPGLIARHLVNLTTYQAITEFDRRSEELGLHMSNPEQGWQILAAWLAYFVPDMYTKAPGGRALYR